MTTKTITLDANELYYLKIILCADYDKYQDRVAHAASHGDQYSDIRGVTVEKLLHQLEL